MLGKGPPIEALTRRLAETPDDFLGASRPEGTIDVAAVVFDLVHDLGGEPVPKARLSTFIEGDPRRRTLILIAAWLLHDSWFRDQKRFGAAALEFLTDGLDDIAANVQPRTFVTDPDRREELARRTLLMLDLLPADETLKQAADRLTTLDSVDRQRVDRETNLARERVRKVQEAPKAAEVSFQPSSMATQFDDPPTRSRRRK